MSINEIVNKYITEAKYSMNKKYPSKQKGVTFEITDSEKPNEVRFTIYRNGKQDETMDAKLNYVLAIIKSEHEG